jgi:ribonuclease HI
VEDKYIPLIIAFNAAVWKFRKPAHDSLLERPKEWLVNRLVELATTILSSIKPKARKSKKVIDAESESVTHNEKVAGMAPDCVLCYSDGSASPNPGPCGAGVSIFFRDPDMVTDYGASLGRGTNNYAELYGLGIIFTRLASLQHAYPKFKRAVVFCDSKLALRAAVSTKNPITNGPITRAVRAAFLAASRAMTIDLQWIRGHALYGGNERVDKISKAYASIANNDSSFPVCDAFPAHGKRSRWDPGFEDFTLLPISCFLRNLPQPTPIAPNVVGLDNTHTFTVLNDNVSLAYPEAQVSAARNSRRRIKPPSLPTRSSARLNHIV